MRASEGHGDRGGWGTRAGPGGGGPQRCFCSGCSGASFPADSGLRGECGGRSELMPAKPTWRRVLRGRECRGLPWASVRPAPGAPGASPAARGTAVPAGTRCPCAAAAERWFPGAAEPLLGSSAWLGVPESRAWQHLGGERCYRWRGAGCGLRIPWSAKTAPQQTPSPNACRTSLIC